jgi:hypothetical protein
MSDYKAQTSGHDEDDDYQAASRMTTDYSRFVPPVGKQLKSKKHRILNSLVVFLTILLVVGGGYWLFKHTSKRVQPTSNIGQSTPKSVFASTTKQYQSIAFGLTFNYPSDWTVAEDDVANNITAHSLPMSLMAGDGSKTTGEVVLSVDTSGQTLTMFDKGNAVAILSSVKISYTQPSSTQRAQTYMSFLQYATTSENGALDSIYLTGDFGYQKGQAIPEVDVSKVDPLIRISFLKCSGTACSSKSTPLSIQGTVWNDTNFSQPLENMLKSFVFQ